MLLRTKEVADLIGCTPRNITKMVMNGKLNPIYKGKLYFLFDKREVDNYLNNGGQKK